MRQLMSENWGLLVQRNPIEQLDTLRVFIVVTGNALSIRLYDKFPQVEILGQQPELLHRPFRTLETLRVFLFRQTLACKFLHISRSHKTGLYFGMFGEAAILGGKSEQFIYRAKEFFGVVLGHLHFFGMVLAELTRNIAQALAVRGIVGLSEGKAGE